MKRRDFLMAATAGTAGLVAAQAVVGQPTHESRSTDSQPTVEEKQTVSFACEGTSITVQTKRFTAVFQGPRLTRFSTADGRVLLEHDADSPAPLELLDPSDKAFPIGVGENAQVRVVSLGPTAADMIISDWNGDATLRIEVDEPSGDLCVTPAAACLHGGVARLRWNLAGIKPELDLVAPFFQGIRLKLNDPLIARSRWNWPDRWEAALAILQADDAGGFSICCHDDRFRYKNLYVGHPGTKRTDVLGLETENYAPWHDQQAVGSLTWRLNAHTGDWRVAAEPYRRWLWKTYDLERVKQSQPAWTKDVTLAVSWCPCQPELLDALAKRHPPHKTLLHVPNWRDRKYDQDYPRYVASESARAFLAKAQAMGFHVMPHFNFFGVDPRNPVSQVVRPFVYRKLGSTELDGWVWKGRVLGLPQSGSQLSAHPDANFILYIHPGLSWWRACLREQIAAVAEDLKLNCVFIDQTLHTSNIENCLVENQTTTEGMWRLNRELAAVGGGLTLAGEGRNEISMQRQSFAQAHLFLSWQDTIEGLGRVPCPVNAFLFDDLCRTTGYTGLDGRDEKSALRMQVHARLGAIPTVTVRSADQIERPNKAIAEELARAASL